MKKLILAIVVALIGLSLVSCKHSSIDKSSSCKHDKLRSLTGTGLTLNGISFSDANNMVNAFIDNNISSDTKTDIWLSKVWVDSISALLDTEKADGFRIYFAKDTTNGKNTVVIVSTSYYSDDNDADSYEDHLDYFDHNSSFLQGQQPAQITNRQLSINYPGAGLYDPMIKWTRDTCALYKLNHITNLEAYGAVQNFINHTTPQGINTKSEWFPACLLKNLKAELEEATKQDSTRPGDGIRIYFAKKTNKPSNPKHKNRHCFIIATTRLTGNIHQDYYQCYNRVNYCDSTKTHNDFTSTDNGEECPNNCNGVALPKP